jgi:hypothetical protein
MPTDVQVPEIVDEVRRRLAAEAGRGVALEVADFKLEDDWLYVVVTPGAPGVRASDHAALMSKIERELRQAGKTRVLLVPALAD